MPAYRLTQEQEAWTNRRRHGLTPGFQRQLLIEQKGKCAISGVTMCFHIEARTPVPRGCHPLAPSIDHENPGDPNRVQIVCYALNDLKGHLPYDCFKALAKTEEWKRLMAAWKKQAAKDPCDRTAFARLVPTRRAANRQGVRCCPRSAPT